VSCPREKDGVDPEHRLWLNLYSVWHSFRSMCRSFGSRSLTNPKVRLDRLAKRLPAIQSRLKGVEFRNDDCYQLIDEFKDDTTAFIYCDPPYYKTNNSGYKHKTLYPNELARALSRCRGKWLVTYNDHPVVREAFKDYRITTIPTSYSVGGSKPVVELVIANY
jgi:DNA adenine methylase